MITGGGGGVFVVGLLVSVRNVLGVMPAISAACVLVMRFITQLPRIRHRQESLRSCLALSRMFHHIHAKYGDDDSGFVYGTYTYIPLLRPNYDALHRRHLVC